MGVPFLPGSATRCLGVLCRFHRIHEQRKRILTPLLPSHLQLRQLPVAASRSCSLRMARTSHLLLLHAILVRDEDCPCHAPADFRGGERRSRVSGEHNHLPKYSISTLVSTNRIILPCAYNHPFWRMATRKKSSSPVLTIIPVDDASRLFIQYTEQYESRLTNQSVGNVGRTDRPGSRTGDLGRGRATWHISMRSSCRGIWMPTDPRNWRG